MMKRFEKPARKERKITVEDHKDYAIQYAFTLRIL